METLVPTRHEGVGKPPPGADPIRPRTDLPVMRVFGHQGLPGRVLVGQTGCVQPLLGHEGDRDRIGDE